MYLSGVNLPVLKFIKIVFTYFHHISPTCRITSATQGFTQLHESIDRLVTWLDDAEVRATGGGDLENSERLELLQVYWASELVFRIVRLSSHFSLGDQVRPWLSDTKHYFEIYFVNLCLTIGVFRKNCCTAFI